jgi:hypothetical protein
MRTRIHLAVLLLTALVSATPSFAQDAAQVINQYVKAAGGANALSHIQTLTLEGTATRGSDGKSGTYTLDTKQPNRYYAELIVGDTHLIEAYNGKSAWRQDGSGGTATMLGPDAAQMEALAQIANSRLVNLKKSKSLATFVGRSQVRGKDALQVEVTNISRVKYEIFFDPQTHFIVKEGAVDGNPDTIFFGDYRPENGIQLPHKIELHRGGQEFDISITRAVVNVPVGERVFDLPLTSQVRLPDLKALFKEIDDNQKAIDKIKENYAGTRVEEETEYDSDGKVKKHEVNEYTFFYFSGEEISTLVKKDGKPLSEAEQKKETDNAQKRIEEIQKSEARKEAKEEKAKQEGKTEEKDKDDPDIETFLRTCQFVNPRRERFRGQDVLVFDFEANPEYKPRNLVEKIVQKLAGVIWIDETAHDVVRLEAYFANDAKIAGGLLANLQKGTSFTFEQAFINNEVWLPTYEEAHANVRVLLVKGFRVSGVTRYSDYKRYHVDVQSVVGAPKPQ